MAAIETLEIISPGIMTSVQDLGRYGYGRFGVAPSGALDSFSLRIANLLVGNREDQACLETMLLGPGITVLTDTVIAVTGGNLQPRRNKQPIDMWCSHFFKKDDVLSFGNAVSGFRAYIAVAGGIGVPRVMGSRSTNLSSGFGGHQGRTLRKKDLLVCEEPRGQINDGRRIFNPDWIPNYSNEWKLRVVWGPQDDDFPEDSRHTFLSGTYTMSQDSDRTGIRLAGPEILCKPDIEASIISEGVIAGCIQIPGDGKPIIILGETVSGGYRKIATVISADLPSLGQIKPGDGIQFGAVSLGEAYLVLQEMEDRINDFKRKIN
ncbi:MAG: biotin-dependent carboxyltransferase family protein [Proteobacteria bacterium]|nr:biotin-dependent carboxyltransferase family protein [Pseudomonadota bacterium]